MERSTFVKSTPTKLSVPNVSRRLDISANKLYGFGCPVRKIFEQPDVVKYTRARHLYVSAVNVNIV